MELTITNFLIVCPLVFLAGLTDGIAGGGGLISLPAYLLAGVPPHMALGTNKLSSCIGTAASTFRFYKNGYMDMQLGIFSIIFALFGSAIGSSVVLLLDEKVISHLMIVILPIVSFYVLRNKNLNNQQVNRQSDRRKDILLATLISFLIGGYDGFYGPGTGTFFILAFTGIINLDVKTAAGNSKLVNLASNVAAVTVFLLHGKVIFLLGICASVFSIAGHYFGAGLVINKGVKIVRPIIIVVLVALFIKIVTG
ncbi:MAG: sulfite exporter TauE/SafE family protein [Clostridia bacterium]